MNPAWTAVDWALLLLRVTSGLIFVAHGWPKAITEIDKHSAAFARNGIPFPRVMTLLVGWLELAGGVLLVAGILVEPVSLLLALTMVVAIWKVKWKKGFVNETDFALIVLVVCVALVLTGPGAIAPVGLQLR